MSNNNCTECGGYSNDPGSMCGECAPELRAKLTAAEARAESAERALAVLNTRATATDEELLRVVNELAEVKAQTDALVKALPKCGRFCLPSNVATKTCSIGLACDSCEFKQPPPKEWNTRDLPYTAPLRAILAKCTGTE